MSKYARRVDNNARDVFAVLKAFGVPYDDFQSVGRGISDGIAWVKGAWHLFEIKNPAMSYGKRGLNDTQRDWLTRVNGGPIYILESAADAELFARGKLSKVKAVWPKLDALEGTDVR